MTVVRNPGLAVGTTWTAAALDGGAGGAGEPVPSPAVPDGRFLAEVPVGGGARLGEMGAAGAEALVCAVPDHWLHRGEAGALERERLARALEGGLGLPAPVFVGHGQAVLAGLGGAGPVLVCDVGARTVDVTLCAAADGELDVLDAECARPAGPDGYEHRLVAACRGVGARAETLVHALRRELRDRPERAELVLVRARALERYRATPVYAPAFPGDGVRLTAGQVLDSYEPVAAAVRAAVAALLGRGAAREIDVAAAGGVPPLTRAAVLEGAAAAGWRVRSVREAGADVAARGAALIAAGAVRAREPRPVDVRLPARRIAGGLLRRWDIPLPVGGRGAPAAVEADGDGRDLELETAAGAPLPVSGPPVPAGRLALTYWPNRRDGGAVVVRPADGGAALAYAIIEERSSHG